jgi:hypothetical protein
MKIILSCQVIPCSAGGAGIRRISKEEVMDWFNQSRLFELAETSDLYGSHPLALAFTIILIWLHTILAALASIRLLGDLLS